MSRLEGDQVANLWGWIKRLILENYIDKNSNAIWTIKGRLIVWMSWAMVENNMKGIGSQQNKEAKVGLKQTKVQ